MDRITHSFQLKAALLILTCLAFTSAFADESVSSGQRIEADKVDCSGCTRIYEPDYEPAYLTGYRDSSDAWYAIYEWIVSYSDKTLSVTWLNMGANCCPEEYQSWRTEDESGLLNLHAKISGDLCSCVCTYDLTGTFSGIEPGDYTLRLSRGMEYTDFDVTLKEGYEDKLVKVYGPEYPQDGRIAGEEVQNSACKSNQSNADNNMPRSQKSSNFILEDTPLQWQLSYSNGSLHLTWMNVSGNCATQGFYTWMYNEDNVLDFYIFETEEPGIPLADCMCDFDVDSVFPDIKPGTYRLRFHNPYKNRVYETTATLEEGFEAHYTGNRLANIDTIDTKAGGMYLTEGVVLCCSEEGSYTLEIVATDGLSPILMEAEGYTEVSLSTLPAGIYIARLTTTDGKTSTLRFRR